MGLNAEQPKRKPEYRVEALARGLRILRLFSETTTSLRLHDVAARAGVPVPTAFRLISTLEEEGFLERLPDGSLRPALSVLRLGFSALKANDIVQVSTPALQRLADTVAHTVNIGVLRGDQVLYVARIRNDANLVTANVQVGSMLPAIFTSMGKLLLAFLAREEVDALIAPGAYQQRLGPNGVRSPAELHQQLAVIRRQGWATQDEEVAYGLRSISGPLRDGTGAVVAAVNIAVNASACTLDEMTGSFREPLLDVCDEISNLLGAPMVRAS